MRTLTARRVVERGYNNRAAVPDHPRFLAQYAALSQAARAKYAPQLDLRYGPNPREVLDLFVPAGTPRGTFVFIHGGYWRALDKDDFSFVAGPMRRRRAIAVAVIDYDLCPRVHDRDDRRRMPARARVGRARRAEARRGGEARGRRRPLGRRTPRRDDVRDAIGASTDLRARPSPAASRCRACTIWRPLIAFLVQRGLPARRRRGARACRRSSTRASDRRAAADRLRRRRDERVPAPVAAAVGRLAGQPAARRDGPLLPPRQAPFQRRPGPRGPRQRPDPRRPWRCSRPARYRLTTDRRVIYAAGQVTRSQLAGRSEREASDGDQAAGHPGRRQAGAASRDPRRGRAPAAALARAHRQRGGGRRRGGPRQGHRLPLFPEQGRAAARACTSATSTASSAR